MSGAGEKQKDVENLKKTKAALESKARALQNKIAQIKAAKARKQKAALASSALPTTSPGSPAHPISDDALKPLNSVLKPSNPISPECAPQETQTGKRRADDVDAGDVENLSGKSTRSQKRTKPETKSETGNMEMTMSSIKPSRPGLGFGSFISSKMAPVMPRLGKGLDLVACIDHGQPARCVAVSSVASRPLVALLSDQVVAVHSLENQCGVLEPLHTDAGGSEGGDAHVLIGRVCLDNVLSVLFAPQESDLSDPSTTLKWSCMSFVSSGSLCGGVEMLLAFGSLMSERCASSKTKGTATTPPSPTSQVVAMTMSCPENNGGSVERLSLPADVARWSTVSCVCPVTPSKGTSDGQEYGLSVVIARGGDADVDVEPFDKPKPTTIVRLDYPSLKTGSTSCGGDCGEQQPTMTKWSVPSTAEGHCLDIRHCAEVCVVVGTFKNMIVVWNETNGRIVGQIHCSAVGCRQLFGARIVADVPVPPAHDDRPHDHDDDAVAGVTTLPGHRAPLGLCAWGQRGIEQGNKPQGHRVCVISMQIRGTQHVDAAAGQELWPQPRVVAVLDTPLAHRRNTDLTGPNDGACASPDDGAACARPATRTLGAYSCFDAGSRCVVTADAGTGSLDFQSLRTGQCFSSLPLSQCQSSQEAGLTANAPTSVAVSDRFGLVIVSDADGWMHAFLQT